VGPIVIISVVASLWTGAGLLTVILSLLDQKVSPVFGRVASETHGDFSTWPNLPATQPDVFSITFGALLLVLITVLGFIPSLQSILKMDFHQLQRAGRW
jgi:hypothetical protein